MIGTSGECVHISAPLGPAPAGRCVVWDDQVSSDRPDLRMEIVRLIKSVGQIKLGINVPANVLAHRPM